MRDQSGRRRPNAAIPLAQQARLTRVRRDQAVYKLDQEPIPQSSPGLRSSNMKTLEETRNKQSNSRKQEEVHTHGEAKTHPRIMCLMLKAEV